MSLPAASAGSSSRLEMTLFLSGHLQRLHISPLCCASFFYLFLILQKGSIKMSDLFMWDQLPFVFGFCCLTIISQEEEKHSCYCMVRVPGFNEASLSLER